MPYMSLLLILLNNIYPGSQYIPALSRVSNKYLATSPDENIKLKYWTFYAFTVLKEYRGRQMLMKIGEDRVSWESSLVHRAL
jgi:hypothetical protein